MTHEVAAAACIALNSELASINDEAENVFAGSLLGPRGVQWLGGRRITGDAVDKFYWSDGSLFDFQEWYTNEPNNKRGKEDCISQGLKAEVTSRWNDANCEQERPFLCKGREPRRFGEVLFYFPELFPAPTISDVVASLAAAGVGASNGDLFQAGPLFAMRTQIDQELAIVPLLEALYGERVVSGNTAAIFVNPNTVEQEELPSSTTSTSTSSATSTSSSATSTPASTSASSTPASSSTPGSSSTSTPATTTSSAQTSSTASTTSSAVTSTSTSTTTAPTCGKFIRVFSSSASGGLRWRNALLPQAWALPPVEQLPGAASVKDTAEACACICARSDECAAFSVLQQGDNIRCTFLAITGGAVAAEGKSESHMRNFGTDYSTALPLACREVHEDTTPTTTTTTR